MTRARRFLTAGSAWNAGSPVICVAGMKIGKPTITSASAASSFSAERLTEKPVALASIAAMAGFWVKPSFSMKVTRSLPLM